MDGNRCILFPKLDLINKQRITQLNCNATKNKVKHLVIFRLFDENRKRLKFGTNSTDFSFSFLGYDSIAIGRIDMDVKILVMIIIPTMRLGQQRLGGGDDLKGRHEGLYK